MKTQRLRLAEAAVADILEQADWYERQSNLELGQRWETAVTKALVSVSANPESGALCRFSATRLAGVRRTNVPRFPKHLVFYQVVTTRLLFCVFCMGHATWRACSADKLGRFNECAFSRLSVPAATP